MKACILLAALSLASGCADRQPFPLDRFHEIARRCGFTAVTYTPRKTLLFGDEPLIDFSAERDSKKAMECFDKADLEISKERTTDADLGITFVWEYRS